MKYVFNENEITDIFKELFNQKNELVTDVKWEFFPSMYQGESDTHLLTLETKPITPDMRLEWEKLSDIASKAIEGLKEYKIKD